MRCTRRQILAALLGAPLAAAACRRPPPRPVPGRIAGGAMVLGHRLRDPPRVDPPRDRRRVGVAIVGAGPAGLSAAWRLERLGVRDYAVFDLEDRPGGTSRSGDDGPVPYPWGAHYVPAPPASNRALVELLREIGAVEGVDDRGDPVFAEEQIVRAPEERIFYKGKWYEGLYLRAGASSEDLAELDRFHAEIDRLVAWRDARGRRAFALPIAHGSDDAELRALDRTSMHDWLESRGLRGERIRWWADYACRDDYGLRATETSAWAGLFYFASRVGDPGQEAAPLLAWPAGNGRLVDHLARAAAGRIRTRAIVVDVVPREDGVDLVAIDASDGAGRVEAWTADHAIVAVPRYAAARIVRPWRDRPPDFLGAFEYGAWLVANVHLRARPGSRGFPTAWDNVLYESPSLGYVVATHQALVDHGPTVWTWYYAFCDPDARAGRERLAALGHAAACDLVLSDLGRAHEGLADAVERIDVWRWGHGMVRPRPGAVWSGARARAAEPLGRVRFAHSDLSGVSLFEEAQYWGVRAAEEVARARGIEAKSLVV